MLEREENLSSKLAKVRFKDTFSIMRAVIVSSNDDYPINNALISGLGVFMGTKECFVDLETENRDLVWDLDSLNQRQQAIDFVMGFENKICIYSSSVEQLYTNYNIFFPKEESRKLVILPNPYAHHDTYQGIPEAAVTATGLHIIPGGDPDKPTLQLTIPFKSGRTKYRQVPLQVGLRVINQRRPANSPLLPVVMKGDLRELDAKTPCLHLHCIHLGRLERMSALDSGSICKVISERLAVMA